MGQDFSNELEQESHAGPSTSPEPTQGAYARRDMELAIVREGTPAQIGSLLRDMEQRGKIENGILSGADDAILTETAVVEDETDCDLDFSDEDDFGSGDSFDGNQTIVSGNGNWEKNVSAFDSSQKFTLYFYESGGHVACWMRRDPRSAFSSVFPKETKLLDELASRYGVLERMGEWLSVNRSEFLQTGDLWDFAKNALSEAENKWVSVLQKDFIEIAKLNCNASSFSRFIRHAVLFLGPTGSLPVGQLFSKKARCAWVARAFRDHCRRAKLDIDKSIKALQVAKNNKTNRADRARKALQSMSREMVASLLCQLAGVGGANVVETYGNKIKED